MWKRRKAWGSHQGLVVSVRVSSSYLSERTKFQASTASTKSARPRHFSAASFQPTVVSLRQSGRVGTKNSLGPDPPASVARRNACECIRIKKVNTGFAVLRQHIIPVLCGSVIVYGGSPHYSEPLSSSSSSPPATSSSSKKNQMSIVETLRCAVEYIRNLEKLLATSGGSEMEQDQLSTKEKPLDCLPYKLDVAVGSPSMQESSENISPLEIAGLSTSANDLMSGFYDSTSPTGAVPTGEQKRIKTERDPTESATLFKQELLRSLSCWNRSDAEQPVPELLLDHPGQTEQKQNSAIQNIMDHSRLESLNSWWSSSL
ncbi:achaete-scute complex protein T3-like [Daphnia pulex]|uniref:achaete-scute complex protein T3-like n=1 Tax=Daphnia pulex TaxID=6669 RepID=UPI001EE0CD67|nr:achaete-scute complex protein T3-like [Daphnia pulex]